MSQTRYSRQWEARNGNRPVFGVWLWPHLDGTVLVATDDVWEREPDWPTVIRRWGRVMELAKYIHVISLPLALGHVEQG